MDNQTDQPTKHRSLVWPVTRHGWWAIGLMALYTVLSILNMAVFMRETFSEQVTRTILPFYGIFMLLCGIACAIIALVAIIRKKERSILVWICLLPGLFVLFLVFGELLFPH
jgi:ATP/ADP translocase